MNSPSVRDAELLLRETNHRCGNDLQLVMSLLAIQSRRASDPAVRQALADARDRVSILARARGAMQRDGEPSLQVALHQLCEALHAQAEPRAIRIGFTSAYDAAGITPTQVTTLALVVNELTTNAIKHAFAEGRGGHIHVSVDRHGERDVVVTVDDDGLPFPEPEAGGGGMGLDLVKRLMVSIGGLLIPPPAGRKIFELRVPLAGG